MLDIQRQDVNWKNAYAGFDYVTDPDLIDCYIYEQNAVREKIQIPFAESGKPKGLRTDGKRITPALSICRRKLYAGRVFPLTSALDLKAQPLGRLCFYFELSEHKYCCA